MKLNELHGNNPSISWSSPNIDREWAGAENYREVFPDKKSYLEKAKKGSISTIHPNIQLKIKKFTGKGSYDGLDPEKKQRVDKSFDGRNVEMPILLQRKDGTFDLLAGNARMVKAMDKELPIQALIIPE